MGNESINPAFSKRVSAATALVAVGWNTLFCLLYLANGEGTVILGSAVSEVCVGIIGYFTGKGLSLLIIRNISKSKFRIAQEIALCTVGGVLVGGANGFWLGGPTFADGYGAGAVSIGIIGGIIGVLPGLLSGFCLVSIFRDIYRRMEHRLKLRGELMQASADRERKG